MALEKRCNNKNLINSSQHSHNGREDTDEIVDIRVELLYDCYGHVSSVGMMATEGLYRRVCHSSTQPSRN